MFIVLTHGGTGNQLFQYAFARALAGHTKREVILCSTTLGNKEGSLGRINFLPKLKPKLKIATNMDKVNIYLVYKLHRWLKRKFNRHFPNSQKWGMKYEIGERSAPGLSASLLVKWDPTKFHELESLCNNHNRVILYGYWQYASIVSSSKQELLEEFAYTQELSANHKSQIEQIRKCNESVALHLRLNHNAELYHSSDDYYKEAIRLIRNKRKNPFFFVFTDHSLKASKLLPRILTQDEYSIMSNDNYKYMRLLDETIDPVGDYQSLLVMSECKDFIMSKSTFCWWAAWFNWARSKNLRGIYIIPSAYKENFNFSPKHCVFL